MIRALFVNSGILGHASVARLIRDAVARDPGIEAVHVDLSAGLTAGEKVLRRAMCTGPRPGSAAGALTMARFRHEMHAGVQAARRIAALEKETGRFDVIHFHTQATAWASLGRMRSTPSIVSIDATQRLAAGEAASVLAKLEHAPNAARDLRVFRAAAAIVATSRWVVDDLVRQDAALAEKAHVLPYPVPLEGFDPRWTEERHARAAADPSAPVRFLFVGGDFPRKGGPDLLREWRAGGFASTATLTVVSDWPIVEVPDGVRVRRGVKSYTPEWFDLWRDADVFVMPTRGEAFGMVFQEAAAAGVPAIGTKIGAISEIVVGGGTGILIAPGDVGALAEAMGGLLASPERRRKMGLEAREGIERTASVERYSERLTAIVRAAAGRRADG